MGRRNQKLPTPTLMGVVASRRLHQPVSVVDHDDSFTMLQLRPAHWKKLSIKQKLTAANITLHREGETYAFTLVLSPHIQDSLTDPDSAKGMFDYVRDRVRMSFKEAGFARRLYWYVLENADKHALSGKIERHKQQGSVMTGPHLHGGFSVPHSDTAGSIHTLEKLLKKNLGGNRPRSLNVKLQGSEASCGAFKRHSVKGLTGYPGYACKNLPITFATGFDRPYVLSRDLQRSTIQTMSWLSTEQ